MFKLRYILTLPLVAKQLAFSGSQGLTIVNNTIYTGMQGPILQGNGNIVIREHPLREPVERVTCAGNFRFTFNPKLGKRIFVKCDSNLQDIVGIDTSNGRLSLVLSASQLTPSKPLEVFWGGDSPSVISTSGTGRITLQDLNDPNLSVKSSGTASIEASGFIEKFSLSASGTGRFDGTALFIKNAEFELSGTIQVTANIQEKIEGEIGGVSSLTYMGTAKDASTCIGSGTVENRSAASNFAKGQPPGLPKGVQPKSPNRKVIVSGSGVVVDALGHLITNEHVVENAEKISITVNNNTYTAKVLADDEQLDLALLKLEKYLGRHVQIQLQTPIGTEVYALGYPLPDLLGEGLKITNGLVNGEHPTKAHTLWQISAPIQQGNSGGPLLDKEGDLVGINVSVLGLAPESVGFSIKSQNVVEFLTLHNIKYKHTPNHSEKLDSMKIYEYAKEFTAYIEVERRE
jgi:S1-C subfamily serine protease